MSREIDRWNRVDLYLANPMPLFIATAVTLACGGGGNDNDPCDKKLDEGLLLKAGIEKMEHSIKIESVGRENILKFDFCGCNNGRVFIKEHGCKGKNIVDETEYMWK